MFSFIFCLRASTVIEKNMLNQIKWNWINYIGLIINECIAGATTYKLDLTTTVLSLLYWLSSAYLMIVQSIISFRFQSLFWRSVKYAGNTEYEKYKALH